MRLELIPLLLGVLLGLVGLGLVLDGWLEDDTLVSRERRRRPRTERHRGGEVLLGLGTLAMAIAFIGRDGFRYSILIALIGVPLLLIGGWKNRRYLRESVMNRGASRRGQPRPPTQKGENRIR